jgi:thiol-disulfide isomerase/thioredoxin
MKEIHNLEEFYSLIASEKITVIYVYANWCPDCFVTKRELLKLRQKWHMFQWLALNRDQFLDLAKHLRIFGIPSFLVYKRGEEIKRYVDKQAKSFSQVDAFLRFLD